jgi:hypothetical protein
MKLLKSNVLSVLLYGSEILKMTKGDEKILWYNYNFSELKI